MADWQAGDLALCVKSGVGCNTTVSGGVYTVERVWVHPNRSLVLDFVGIYNGENDPRSQFWGHLPRRFRKISPHTPDEQDAETIALLSGQHIPVEA